MTVAIAAAVRSPFAAADGVLAGWHPVDLAALVMNAALGRAGLAADAVDLVVAGCAEPVGAQGANAAHACVLAADWPASIPGLVIDAESISGFAALAAAHDAIVAGRAHTVVVVGLNSASMVQPGAGALGRIYGRPWGAAVEARYADDGGLVPPITVADRAAEARGIDRSAQDAWGMRSLERRATSTTDLVTVGARPGDSVAVQRDTPVDRDVLRSIPTDGLEPVFDADGTTTAAGLAPAADGVAVIVLVAEAAAPIGELVDVRIGAGDPSDPTAGLDVARGVSTTRWTVAEASASTALLAADELGLDPARVNPDGGAIAVGDAAAAEDLRMVIDALHAAQPGEEGAALRTGGGAAAMSLWRRS